jgi:uncharacterized membrane protein (UPF0127 family)
MMTSPPRFDRRAALRVLAAGLLFACAGLAVADARTRTTTIKVGSHALRVEVVATDAERQKGLMFREKLGRNDGMLFVFDEPAYHSMWMKNTLIPLSVAFVDAKGEILNVLDMEPHSLDTRMAAGPASYAIETNRGWFAERGLKAGDRVTGLPPARK